MSAPYCTSLPASPTLGADGLLHWSNGGWACDSGPITNYISHIYADDGTSLCGAVPAFRYDGTKPITAPGLDQWVCETLEPGRWVTLDLYAVTHSVYAGFYDWWEVGNHMGADPTKTASVRFTMPNAVPPPTPPVGQPNIGAAQTWLVEALNSLIRADLQLRSSYAWAHSTAASFAAVRAADTDVAQANVQIGKAQAFLRGESP